MRRIVGDDLSHIEPYFKLAAEVARSATCHRAKCGSVIINDGEVIGRGFNSPPLNDESRRTCECEWDSTKKPKYDLTCCIHAEWRAVLDAAKSNPKKLVGSTLYFMRVDNNGDYSDAGLPYCTTCSRLTMESGVKEFALWNNNGADIYLLSEYDALSYDYYRK